MSQPSSASNPNTSSSSNAMEDDIIGVIKIKDGLFICDEFGA